MSIVSSISSYPIWKWISSKTSRFSFPFPSSRKFSRNSQSFHEVSVQGSESPQWSPNNKTAKVCTLLWKCAANGVAKSISATQGKRFKTFCQVFLTALVEVFYFIYRNVPAYFGSFWFAQRIICILLCAVTELELFR